MSTINVSPILCDEIPQYTWPFLQNKSVVFPFSEHTVQLSQVDAYHLRTLSDRLIELADIMQGLRNPECG